MTATNASTNIRIGAILTAAVSLAGLLAGCDQPLSQIPSLGTLERDRIELVADSSEPIESILVHEGQRVAAGAALLVQSSERAAAALARARADEAATKSVLAEAERGPRAQAIEQARARLQASKSARLTARHELDRQKSLVARNYTTASQVDILQGRFDEALARESEARAALDELNEGTRSEKIDQARSRYAAATATVTDLKITLARATIRSPVAATIETLPFEIGERPRIGATAVVVLADGPTYARVHVQQALRTRIKSGTPALVHIDGYPDGLPAVVRWVASDAAFTPYFALSQHDRSRLSFLAEVDLTSPGQLPIGIPVEVSFPEIEP
jgi:HlyD family secretion protein